MDLSNEIINRVSASSLITFNLEDYYQPGDRAILDIKEQLFEGLILREKDFRDFIKHHPWEKYQDKFVAITCSADAIIPTWAYMLLAIHLEPYASFVIFGSMEELESELLRKSLASVNWADFKDMKVVVKGCSKVDVPVTIYVEVAAHLRPYVSSLMFGEPCSTVPLFKKPILK